MSIRPERILNYVSARTYEKYMADKEAMANLSAKDLRRLQREQEKSAPSRGGPAKRSRKRKHMATEEVKAESEVSTVGAGLTRSPVMALPGSAGRKRKLEGANELTLVSPRPQNPRKPSFSSPTKQRGLAELVPSDSDEEMDDTLATEAALKRQLIEDEMDDTFDDILATEAAIERQFDENMRRQSGLLGMQLSSASTSPERTEARVDVFIKPNKPRSLKGPTGQTRSLSTSTGNNSTNTPRQNNRQTSIQHRRKDSVASLSSREAAMIYEDLEKGEMKAMKGSIGEKYSRFFNESSDAIASKSPPKSKKPANPPAKKRRTNVPLRVLEEEESQETITADDDDDDDEYEVEDILGEEYRDDIDGRSLYYLIKWVGDWDNTWEPAANVGSDVISGYKMKKQREERLKREREERSMSHDSSRKGSRNRSRKGSHSASGRTKTKASTQSAPTAYDSEEESLFLPERPPARSAGVSTGKGKGKGKETKVEMPPPPKRGEVIDDDTDDSNQF
jgi:hypothetical protein